MTISETNEAIYMQPQVMQLHHRKIKQFLISSQRNEGYFALSWEINTPPLHLSSFLPKCLNSQVKPHKFNHMFESQQKYLLPFCVRCCRDETSGLDRQQPDALAPFPDCGRGDFFRFLFTNSLWHLWGSDGDTGSHIVSLKRESWTWT